MCASPSSEERSESAYERSVLEVSAGGAVVRRIEGEPHLLVILDPYGKWGLPKGHLEDGESDAMAAAREVREETGLEDVRVGPLLATLEWAFTREGRRVRKRCTFFLMTSIEGYVSPQVEEGITACDWLPIREAANRIDYENTRVVVRLAEEKVGEMMGRSVSE